LIAYFGMTACFCVHPDSPQSTTENFQSSDSRLRGKKPCLARHAALRCGIFSLQEGPFFEQIPGLAIWDC
jgi:hypothetical protein